MFHHLAPVVGGFGLKMLKKMGWQEGCPLGIHGRGQVEPIALDVKTDRSGKLVIIPIINSIKRERVSNVRSINYFVSENNVTSC